MTDPSSPADDGPQVNWRPLSSRERRVLGVLVEKAKTTPDAYPLTLNALTNGCNQKSNRSPQMELSPEEVEDTLDSLRAVGAVAEIQGAGRVAKFRHHLYEWLGIERLEVAVITELLLRGEQSVGDLRARASRMEKIASLAELQTVLDSLKQKNLLLELSSEGRGQYVTHNLYKQRELDELKSRFEAFLATEARTASEGPSRSSSSSSSSTSKELEALRSEVAELRTLVAELQTTVNNLAAQLE
ncbi:YceH family protein [Lignipirellula cremea]|uniref:Uncharacterized protein n=1 Tax=Lignipirellula cremea TaxID=2528010 RepID=A0A518E0D9_9BACT|nr:DUF480 domain-containing protein [Lignipirellula cremea]QDU97552.1 hypothetical protein Pla8534_54000 [Lignipirellula cremea]